LVVLTNHSGGDATTLRRIALLDGAKVGVGGTRDVRDQAISGGVLADSVLADRRGRAIHREKLASNIWRNQNGAQVLGAKVAIIAVAGLAATLSVTLADIAPIVIRAIGLQGGRDSDFGKHGVALAVEEIETIVVSDGHAIGGGDVVDIEGPGLSSVDASQIQDLLVVEVQEHIIVTKHVEDLSSLVRESSVDSHTKSEIVVLVVFSEILVRTKRNIEPFAVHHEVKEVSVRIHPWGGRGVGKRQIDGHIDGVGRVVEPGEEGGLVVDGAVYGVVVPKIIVGGTRSQVEGLGGEVFVVGNHLGPGLLEIDHRMMARRLIADGSLQDKGSRLGNSATHQRNAHDGEKNVLHK